MHRVAALRALAVGDAPAAWDAAGFRVVDAAVAVGGVTVGLRGAQGGRGLLGWRLEPAAPDGLDGIRHVEQPAHADTEHPNGVVALDHVVVSTPDMERTIAALEGHGLALRRRVRGARGDDDTDYAFLLAGTAVVEVIGPATPAGDGPARLAGLAFTAADPAALGDAWGEPRPAVQPGRHIATLDGRRIGISVPVAALSPRP